MISHEYKCVFVHVPKCAGTTVETYFDDITGHHGPARYYARAHKQAWRNYFRFAFVRNTWEWYTSLHTYWLFKRKSVWFHKCEGPRTAAWKADAERWYRGNVSSFSDAVSKAKYLSNAERTNTHFKPQSSFLFDHKGRLMVDFVGEVGSFDEDFAHIRGVLGCPEGNP